MHNTRQTMRSATSALFLFLATLPLQAQVLLTGPNTLSFTATSGGANPASQTLAIRQTGENPKNFTLSIATQSGGTWLSVSAGAGTTPARLTVTANAGGLPSGTYSGNIQIAATGSPAARVDVTLTVVATSVLQAAPTALSFLRQTGVDAASEEQYVVVNTTGSAAGFTVTPTTTDGGAWLAAAATPNTTPGLIAVRINPAGLAPGSYTGSLSIASPGLTTINVPVTLTIGANPIITANPSPLALAAVRNGSAATQTVAIQTSSGVAAFSATATTATGGNWLIVTPLISSAPGNIDIAANPANLAPGTYTGAVTITAAAAANQTVILLVTFTVTDSAVISAAPRSQTLSLVSSVSAGSALLRELPLINVTSTVASANITTTVSTTNGGAWLSAGSATGTAPGTVSSFVDATGLAPGTYRGQITIQGPGNSVQIPVTLVVTGNAQISVDQTTLTFNLQKGQTPPSSQVVNVLSSGAAYPFQSVITSITPANSQWLTGAVVSGTTPSALPLGVNSVVASALPVGQYTATITYGGFAGSTPPLANAPTLNVVLNVSDTALFTASPSTLDFTAPLNGNSSVPRTVSITSTDGLSRPFSVSTSTTSGGSWLLVGPTSGNTPSNLSVQALPFGLGTGVYEGTIQVTVPLISATPQTIRVRFTIQPSATITAAPNTLAFSQAAGSTGAASRTISVTASNASANYQVATSTTSGGNWLSATPAGGTTPGTITVAINGAGLAAGIYSGSIGISSSDISNSPVQIPVTLAVGAASLAVTPATVSLLATPGSSAPLTQVIALSGGSAPFTATAATTNGGNWLSVNPLTGNTPGSITLTASPVGLTSGTYNGSITIASTGFANSPQIIPVTLTIASVAPTGRQVIAQIADGGGWKTTINLVNLDVEPAPYTLRFYASDGAFLRLPFEGGTPGRLEVLEGVIPVGGSRTIVTAGTDTLLSQGWAELISTKLIGGLGVFRQRVAGRPDQEAGVSAITPMARFVLPFDNTQGFVSSMALANTNLDASRATTVSPRLEDGTILTGDSVNLPARGYTSFALSQRFPSMAGRRGSAEFVSAGPDFGALGFRFNDGGSFTSLPALEVPLTSPTAEITRVISQVADGSGWKTLVTLVNLDTVPAPFTLRFFKADGSSLVMPLTGTSASDVVEGTIAVGGTRIIETLGGESALVQGWAQLTTTRNVNGLAVFRQRVVGRSDQEAAVTLTSTGSRFVLPFDNTTDFTTSMALVNTTATFGTTVSVVIRDEAGAQLAADSISLGGRGYTSFALGTRFASTLARRGTVEFSSSTQITGLGLRFNQNGAFTSFPVMQKR